jgi:RNA ligase (TIGR02306 family)
MVQRKLASIRTISNVRPIPNADKIEVVSVDGWELVARKNEFKPGDICVYFEIDSFLPVEKRYEFLVKSCFRKMSDTGEEGLRIKTMTMRGQISQGLALPLTSFPECANLPVDTDVTEILGVKKYEPPIPACIAGEVKGLFPSFVPITDQERIQNNFAKLAPTLRDSEELFEITVKLDGTSMTTLVDPYADEFLVCSRTLSLKETQSNTLWSVAREVGLEQIIRQINQEYDTHFAFSGELMGPGIQKNKEKLPKHQFFVFDIYDIKQRRYITPSQREKIINQFPQVKHVPILGHISGKELFQHDVNFILKMAEGPSLNATQREGLVFKAKNCSFKAISNKFLLEEE